MTLSTEWAEYRRWNNAISEEFFSGAYGGRPVYLDLEEEVCDAVAIRASAEVEDSRGAIYEAVAPTLHVSQHGEGTFSGHLERLRAWQINGETTWPPFVGALALLSLVAEEMTQDEDFRASNYYGRLLQRLGSDPESDSLRHKLVRDFARQSHILWEGLNDWLLKEPDLRGYPTAYAFDYRAHIGRPLSQALLRDADRGVLLDLFSEWRLDPGNQISPGVMRELLRSAFEAGHFSRTLQRVASDEDALQRLAEVGCAELAAWSGPQAGGGRAHIALIGARRSRPFASLSLTASVADDAMEEEVEVRLLDDEQDVMRQTRATLEPADEFGSRRLGDGLRIADLLVARVEISDGNRTVARRPQILVLLEHRLERGRLEEVGRAQIGGQYVVLVQEGLASDVGAMLDGTARPGWVEAGPSDLRGVPEGWRAFVDVHLLGVPETNRPDLAPLVPVGWTRVSVSGGMSLPGRRAFLAQRPPQIAAAVASSEAVRAVLTPETQNEQERIELGEVGEAAVWDLESFGLETGTWRITLLGEAQSPVGQGNSEGEDDLLSVAVDSERLNLHDADAPSGQVQDPELRHDLAEPLGAVMADRTGDALVCQGASAPEAVDTGASLVALGRELADGRHLEPADAYSDEPKQAEQVSAGVQSVSCIKTGAHRMRPVEGSHARGGEKPWRCIHCGVEKYFPTSWRRMGKGKAVEQQSAIHRAALDLPPLADRAVGHAYHDVLLAALSTARSGSWGSFGRLVAQVDDLPWAPRETARLYSALGMIDVELSATDLEPAAWQISPPTLVQVEPGRAFLAGWRSPLLLQEIDQLVAGEGGSLRVLRDAEWPSAWIEGVDAETLEVVALCADSASTLGGMRFRASPAIALASRLPRLSRLRAALPVGPLPHQGLERYDTTAGRWVSSEEQLVRPGAYRASRGAWRWWHRDASGDVRLADSRIVKWLAAAEEGEQMMAHRAEDQMLVVHQGAPLFGLYERAAALSSGEPPLQLDNHVLAYRGVGADLAAQLAAVLTG